MRRPFLLLLTLVGITLAADEPLLIGDPAWLPTPAHPVGWRGDGTGAFPGATPVSDWGDMAYSTKAVGKQSNGQPIFETMKAPPRNIVWKTPMPAYGNSQPIVVGGRVFTQAEPFSLISLDAATGAILWERSLDPLALDGLAGTELARQRAFYDVALAFSAASCSPQ